MQMEIYRIKSTYTAWAVGRPQRGNVHRAFIIFILIFIYNFPAVGSANPPSGVWVCLFLFLFFVFILFFLRRGGEFGELSGKYLSWPAPNSKWTDKMDPSILGFPNFAKSSKQVIQRCIWIQSNIYDRAFLRK